MEEVLARYIAFQRLALTFKKKLAVSLVYPALLVTVVFGMLIFLVTYVVPQFAKLYEDMNAQLPAITLVMLEIGTHAQTLCADHRAVVWWSLGLFGSGRKPIRGAESIDRAILKIPLLGEIWLKYQVASFSRMLSTLLAGGMPLVPSLETAGASMSSRRILNGITEAAVRVREGQALAKSLEEQKMFPDLSVEMIEVGESTGALPAMLNSVAEFYEEDVQTALGAAMALIEPVILIIMAVFVGGILISLYLPIFTLGIEYSLRDGRDGESEVAVNWQAQQKIRPYSWAAATAAGSRPAAHSEELEKAQDIARRYRCQFVDLHNFQLHHDLFKNISRPPDVPLQLRSSGRNRRRPPGDCHRRSQPVDDDRRNQPAAGQAHRHQSRHSGANQRDSQEDRAVEARAGRCQRRLCSGRNPRRRSAAATKASPLTG